MLKNIIIKLIVTFVITNTCSYCDVNVIAEHYKHIESPSILNVANVENIAQINTIKTTTRSSLIKDIRNDEVFDYKSNNFITFKEFEKFHQALFNIKDAQCLHDLNATLFGIASQQYWAIAIYDASVKSIFGIERGLLQHFGDFDECLQPSTQNSVHVVVERNDNAQDFPKQVHSDTPIFQYCLADVTIKKGFGTRAAGGWRNKPEKAVAQWGVCLPASCGSHDIATFLQFWLQGPINSVSVREKMCQLPHNQNERITKGMFLYAAIILFFIALAVLSSIYHLTVIFGGGQEKDLTKSKQNETLNIALLSFSVIENTKKIFQASKDEMGLNAINGIKALAMLFILAGHALLFIYAGPALNIDFMNEKTKSPTFAFVTNSLLFVDIFLLVGGFLLCRLLLIELERRRGHMNVLILYLGRFVRLTPAYSAIIGFYMTWFPYIGSGPLWRRVEREQARCLESWWLNIFYINNYFNTDKLCMFQSWYLAVDSQLFFISPVAIYLLYHSRKRGVILLVGAVIISTILPFIVSYIRALDPTLLVYSDEVVDLASNSYYTGYYIKTHLRASAYFIGLITGYFVHIIQEKGIKFPPKLVFLLWTLSCVFGFASMHCISRFYATPFTYLESSLYAAFHKLGWNLSIAWMLLAITTNHGGWLTKVLSCRLFVPISRLTYCAYLSNGIVELYHSSSVRHAEYRNYVSLYNDSWSHIFNTFMIAFFVCLIFESPIHALERVLLRKFDTNKKSSNSSDTNEQNYSQTQSTGEEPKV